jgi:hypothetical protein
MWIWPQPPPRYKCEVEQKNEQRRRVGVIEPFDFLAGGHFHKDALASGIYLARNKIGRRMRAANFG